MSFYIKQISSKVKFSIKLINKLYITLVFIIAYSCDSSFNAKNCKESQKLYRNNIVKELYEFKNKKKYKDPNHQRDFLEASYDFFQEHMKDKEYMSNRDFIWSKYIPKTYYPLKDFLSKETLNQEIFTPFLLSKIPNILELDWNLLRKLSPLIVGLHENKIQDIHKKIFSSFLREIENALEYIMWQPEQTEIFKFTSKVLRLFKEIANDDRAKTVSSLISGKFDMNDFPKIEDFGTFILGDDGGLYLLADTLNKLTKPILIEVIGEEYLKSVTKEIDKKEECVIGSGTFGEVRFAISFFNSKSKPGRIICVKKSESEYIARSVSNTIKNSYKRV